VLNSLQHRQAVFGKTRCRKTEAEAVNETGDAGAVRELQLAEPGVGGGACRDVAVGEQDYVAVEAVGGLRHIDDILGRAAGTLGGTVSSRRNLRTGTLGGRTLGEQRREEQRQSGQKPVHSSSWGHKTLV